MRGVGRMADQSGFNLPPTAQARAELRAAIGRISDLARAALETSLANDDRHPPQTGLFLAFAQVLQITRARLNDLTGEHLAFFYRQVLGMAPRGAQPDSTWLLLGLAPRQPPLTLPKGTAFLGPQGPDGQSPRYLSTRSTTLTGAKLVCTRALRLPLDRAGQIAGVLAFENAALPNTPWPAFGPEDPDATTRAAALEAGAAVWCLNARR